MKTISNTLKEYEKLHYRQPAPNCVTVQKFICDSIKEALEAVNPKIRYVNKATALTNEWGLGWNCAINQLEDNFKKFMEGE